MLKLSIDLQFPKLLNWVYPYIRKCRVGKYLHFAREPYFMQYRSRESRSVKGDALRCAARKVGWRFNSKPRVTATRAAPHRPVTRLESFRSAWISDRPVAPASLVSERRDRHGVASSTSLLPLGVFTLVILEPSRFVPTPLARIHVYGVSKSISYNERLRFL